MRKVAILGWYGHDNLGDALILKGLQQLFAGWELVVFTSDHKAAYPYIDFKTINECDLFVLGGGELINARHLFMPSPSILPLKIPSRPFRLYARTPWARRPWTHHITIPKIVLGCGVNTETANQLAPNVVKDLEQFDYIGLRDNVAVDILESVPTLKGYVDLFYDLAFAIRTNDLSWRHSRNRAVVIPTDRFAKSDKGVKDCGIVAKSRAWLKCKLDGYDEIVFLAFGEKDNDDYETCRTLSREFAGSEIMRANRLSVDKVLSLIGDSTITFPFRLHGLILSFITGTKYEFLPYHWKVQRVHDTIKDTNLTEIRSRQIARFREMAYRTSF